MSKQSTAAPAAIRSKLTLVHRRGYWKARGTVPIKTPSGRVVFERREISIGPDTLEKRTAKAEVDRLNQAFEEKAKQTNQEITLTAAITNYVELGHPIPKFAEKIIAVLGETYCHEIDDTAMLRAKKAIFPENARAPYVNRHLYTPVIAAIRLASKGKFVPHPINRPSGYRVHPESKAPPDEWFPKVLAHLNPNARALIAFTTVHGRRQGEAFKCTPEDLDVLAGTLNLGRTKNGKLRQVSLEPNVLKLILAMPGWQSRDHLFRYKPGSWNALAKAIKIACQKAGVPYFTAHKAGRHAFARRLLRNKFSLQHVKQAGGWETISIVSDLYGHLEHSETTAATHKIGGELMKSITPAADIVDAEFQELDTPPTAQPTPKKGPADDR